MGKSTLARAIAQDLRGQAADYIDLENPADLARLEDAAAYLRSRRDRLVVIDEVQRAPGLFQISHSGRGRDRSRAGHARRPALAIEIKRSGAARLEKGCHIAIDDLKPSRSFIVYDGKERYTKSEGVEAISPAELSEDLIRQGRR